MTECPDPPVDEAASEPREPGGGARFSQGRTRPSDRGIDPSIRSKVVFSHDMAGRVLARNWLLTTQFRPNTPYESMLVADMALAKARADLANEQQIENASRYIQRTLGFWNHDQKLRALKLRARLKKNPARVQHMLSGFKQGVELMIEEWTGLAAVIDSGNEWNDAQKSLSLDLRGVAPELRVGNSLFPPTVDKAKMAASAAQEIARLQDLKSTHLDSMDEKYQQEALKGLASDDDDTTKKLKRSERLYLRDYDKAQTELGRAQAVREAQSKLLGIRSGPCTWGEDCVMARLKAIQRPPVAMGDVAPPPPPETDAENAARRAPATKRYAQAAVTTAETAEPVGFPPESDLPTAVAPIRSTSQPSPVIPQPETPRPAPAARPLTRRARKLIEQRLREKARKEAKRHD